MNARLLVMAKAPIPGTVKTRLRLDPEDAARLQTALIVDTVQKSRVLGETTVAGAPKDRLDPLARLLPPDVSLIPQPEGDLGVRMLSGAKTLFDESTDPILILGTDAPTLPPQAILRAAQTLITHDISIVPSKDGGYVLLGLGGLHGAVFSGVEWSTSAVRSQTVARAIGAGLSVYEAEAWYDVDEPEDLQRLEEELRVRPELAPRTAEVVGDL